MEQVQHDITLTAQSIARVEEGVIAVEAAIQKAKAVGDSEELAALRDEKNKLLDEKNKLRDKENKLRDEKVTLLRLQGACDPCTQPICGPERRFTTPAGFKALLENSGVSPDEHVLDTISRSVPLSTLMLACTTSEQAVNVLELAGAVLHSRTKALVRDAGIIVDGVMPVEGVQSAMFFYAFKDRVPHVLKVLTRQRDAKKECQLWLDVRAQPPLDDVFCVPVTPVDLNGQHAVLLAGRGSDVTPLREGILMPRYACTLSNIPVPMEASWALHVLSRISASLRAVHAAGWVHGDVKPSNIFIDFAGDAWLGDYGSSCRMSDVASYTGGTPAFQCADVSVEELARFDRACLAVTLCSAMGVLQPKRAPTVGWPAASVLASLHALPDAALKAELEALLVGGALEGAS